jgi:hypothetical protein
MLQAHVQHDAIRRLRPGLATTEMDSSRSAPLTVYSRSRDSPSAVVMTPDCAGELAADLPLTCGPPVRGSRAAQDRLLPARLQGTDLLEHSVPYLSTM